MNFSKEMFKILKLYILANIIVVGFAFVSVELYLSSSDAVTKTAQHKLSSSFLFSENSKQSIGNKKSNKVLASSSSLLIDILAKSTSTILIIERSSSLNQFNKIEIKIRKNLINKKSRAPPLLILS